MFLELVVFFAITLGISMLTALIPGVIRARAGLGLPVCLVAVAAAALCFAAVDHDPTAARVLGVTALLLTLLMRLLQPRWSLGGCLLFVGVAMSSLTYILYAALVTFTTGLSAGAVVASLALLGLEILALALSVSYTFEIVDVLARRDPAPAVPPLTRTPWVCIQVPTYHEPVEVVQPTLESLAALDYPNLLVQVVDNNTKDPEVWQPIEQLCERLGPRFTFLHLDPWPGFKAGALNEATRRLPEHIEVLGIVDADYRVHPRWLADTVGHFDDPAVAFVQTSQHYRDWSDDGYLRGLFYSFRYFFDITMPARAHRQAIIFAGTMGLIRRAAFEAVGGWNQECVTEDAEWSLRVLGHGWRGVYDAVPYGEGLMPLDFDGLKKQRFRWALGGIQILKLHWRDLVPLARHRLRLSTAQRIHYLLGSTQWFAEVLTATFTVLLLATALATSVHHRLPVRQLTGAVLAIPLAFAATGVARALWAMRSATGCTRRDAFGALRVWFALSWVVTLACLRGLLRRRADFLRTPKHKEGGSLWQALRASRTETALVVAGLAGAVAMVVRTPILTTFVLAGLLLFEAFVYSNAPWASMAAEGIRLTPERLAFARSPQNTGERPVSRNALVAVPVALGAAAAAAALFALIWASPAGQAPFTPAPRDLPPIGQITGGAHQVSTSPSPQPSQTEHSAPESPSPGAASASSSTSSTSTSTSTATSSGTAAPTPSASAASASPQPSSTPVPSSTP